MTSEIIAQANQFLHVISPDLDENQMDYLSWRVCGFSKSESLIYSRLKETDLAKWMEDEQFALLEKQALGELQGKFADDVIVLMKKKNERVVSGIDTNVIQKAFLLGVENLNSQEYDYLKQIRNQFNPDVRRFLGEREHEAVQIPSSFDEAVIMLRRRNGNVNDQTSGETIEAHVIEAEYTESPELPSGEEGGTSEKNTN